MDVLRRAGIVCANDLVQQDSAPHDTVHADIDPRSDRHVLQPRCHRCLGCERLLEDRSWSFARRRAANPACNHSTRNRLWREIQLLARGDVRFGDLGLYGFGPPTCDALGRRVAGCVTGWSAAHRANRLLANRLRARKFDRQDIAETILRVCRSADRHRANPTDVLQKKLEEVWLKEWLEDAAHDAQTRHGTILGLQAAQSCTAAERVAIEAGNRLLSQFESSDAKRNPMKSRATVERSETKRDDDVGGLLLGRTELFIRGATPQQIAAYLLNANASRQENWHRWTTWSVRCCNLATINDHHVISFYRCKASGVADRTFLVSIIAEQLLDDPLTYEVVVVPIPTHDLITAKDEAKAVRAECRRVYHLIEVAPGITRLNYACSLDMKGLVPLFVTNMTIPAHRDDQHLTPLAWGLE
jgi:hypothetical protein